MRRGGLRERESEGGDFEENKAVKKKKAREDLSGFICCSFL